MADRRNPTSQSGSRSRTTKDSKSKTGTLLAPLDRPSTSKSTKDIKTKPGTFLSPLDRPSSSKPTSVSRTSTSTSTTTRLSTSAPSSSRTAQVTKLPTSKPPSSSAAPSSERLQTKYTSTHDLKMASVQTKISTLSPSSRAAQEKWALSKLSSNTGACLDGYGWRRKTICQSNIPGGFTGYICAGGAHFVSDELLVKGNGKCYLLYFEEHDDSHTSGFETWFGPYGKEEVYGIFGGSRRDYERRFERGGGKVDAGFMRGMLVTSSRYDGGEWPHHLTAYSKFFS